MTIIQNYGILWSVDNVHWGRGRQRGSLLGVSARARSSDPVDFRDQVGVYVLYRGTQVVYVGQAGSGTARLFARLRHHHSKDFLAGRWDRFSWFGLRKVRGNGTLEPERTGAKISIRAALDHVEAVLISTSEPALNKQGGRFGKGARKYLQQRDDRLGLSQAEMVKAIWKSLQRR